MEPKEERELSDKLEAMDQRDHVAKQEELLRQSKMGNMPVGKLLLNVSIPIVISMLVQALYNVVDSIFVARLGNEGLAALSLAFPIQNLMMAVSIGTGVGIASRLGRRLGEQNVESANRTANNGVFLMVLSWVAFALFGLFGANLYMSAFTGEGVSERIIHDMGVSYLSIVCVASLPLFLAIAFERFLQSTGRTMFSMASQLVGAITNIILDPIMIYGLFGFPRMEVAGAALATVIGQLFGMLVGLWACVFKNPEITLSFRRFRPSLKTIKHIYQVGLPSIVMQSIGSIMTFGMNKILVGFGTIPVSVFGIYFRLQSFVFMPVLGFNSGMTPIIAFNYGARQRHRITQTVRLTCIICFGIMTAGTVLFWLAPEFLLSLFDASPEMVQIGVKALRTISLSFPAASICIVLSGSFQALGKGTYSLIMSCVRQLVFILPLAWLLARFRGLDAIWWAIPAAEISSIVLVTIFFLRLYNNKIKPLRPDAPLPE